MVEYKAGWNNTNIQETMQRLIVAERKISKINVAMNKYLLRQEDRSLSRSTAMIREHRVETVSFILMLVISLCFIAMAVYNLCK